MAEEKKRIVDPAERAAKGLLREMTELEEENVVVFDGDLKEKVRLHAREAKEASETVPVGRELEAARVAAQSEREKIRVLMISRERNIFRDGSPAQRRIAEYGKLFEELHIIVFTKNEYSFDGVQVAENVWAYPTNSRSRWRYGIDAYRIAKQQLYFAAGFRADVVSAQDPFDAGLIAYIIARRFRRGLHLQVHVDIFEPYFKLQNDYNGARLWLAWFLLPRAGRIRVVSEHLREEISRRRPKAQNRIDVLPIFTDLRSWRDADPEFDLHDRYPRFKFIILMASRLAKEKNIAFAIDACRYVLKQYSTIGLVIVGDGQEREALVTHARERGIADKVVFEPWRSDIRSHMKTADMFLLTSSYEGYGQTLVEAAAAGLPILSTRVGIAPTFFENEKSALLCSVGDMGCVIQGINKYLGNAGLRQLYARAARDRVFSFVESNIDAYHERFRESLERAAVRKSP